ncbi:MAG: Gfo/Idh/MocA family protein [Verrucomicrobiales bacterium]
MSKKATIGLIGCDFHHGTVLLRELLHLEAEVLVVDPSEENRMESIKIGAAEAVSCLDELPKVRGVVIATPPAKHRETVSELLPLKVPVLTDRPFTTDTTAAEKLNEEGGERIYVSHPMRYHPGVELLAKIAASNELGPVEWVRLTRTHWLLPSPEMEPVASRLSTDLSIILEILGVVPEPVSAIAERHRGAVAGVVACLGDDPKVVIESSGRYCDQRGEIRLHCADGVATLPEINSVYLEITRDRAASLKGVAEPERRSFSPSNPRLRLLEDFLNFARNRRRSHPRSSAAEALLIGRIADKIRVRGGIA